MFRHIRFGPKSDALIVARMTGKRVGVDTAMRVLGHLNEWHARPPGRATGWSSRDTFCPKVRLT
jgi:hypothetical protein